MAIELSLASYCQNCRNITPVAVKMSDNSGVFIECEDKKRCAFLARFIAKQMLNEKYWRDQNGNY